MIESDILRKIRTIEIKTTKLVEDYFSGQYESVFKGMGMEFSEVREYFPGDDVRAIDWNVTARFGRPFIKKFTEERELTIVLMVDLSGSEEFGSREKSKAEIACEIGAIIAFSALKNQDKVGLILFTEEPEKYLPAKKGRRHVLRIIREILMYRPQKKGTHIQKALEFLNDVVKRKAVVFLISDFIGENYEKLLRITNKKHDLITIVLNDEREKNLPPIGLLELEDSETGERVLIDSGDPKFTEQYVKLVSEEEEKRSKLFRKTRIDSVEIRSDQSYVTPLYRFFRMRAKRIR
jgi:uncharacterized protein (DUF58 family)